MQDLQDILIDPELRSLLLAFLLGPVLSSILCLLVHEAGHALFGRLAGYRIRLIHLGRGSELFRLHLGLALLVWRLFPASGGVAIYRPLTDVRRAWLMLIAGDDIADVLVASGLAVLLPWQSDPVTHPIVTPLFLVQAVGILNLLFVIGPGRLGTTDGGLFRATLWRPPTTLNRLFTHLYASHVTERYASLSPEPPSALAVLLDAQATEALLRETADLNQLKT